MRLTKKEVVKKEFLSIRLSWLVMVLAGAVCIAFFVMVVIISSRRILSELEAVFFQLVILVTSAVISYVLSLKSATVTARDMVKAHVRPAFRRVVNLYSSLSRLAIRIEDVKRNPDLAKEHVLDVIDAVVREQIPTGADMLDDWRDILPEDVKDLEERRTEENNE